MVKCLKAKSYSKTVKAIERNKNSKSNSSGNSRSNNNKTNIDAVANMLSCCYKFLYDFWKEIKARKKRERDRERNRN